MIQTALISVYNKKGLDKIVKFLHKNKVQIYSTGGTSQFIRNLNIPVNEVEDLTTYPSILGGRVKTLHPKVFGGILSRRENISDIQDVVKFQIPQFDLVIVDLYPFEETVNSNASSEEIIEKIDIGGVSLIRAAAKNFQHVTILCNQKYKNWFVKNKKLELSLEERIRLATEAFKVTTNYDKLINKWMKQNQSNLIK